AYAAIEKRQRLADSARNALVACFFSTAIAALVLALALVHHDFSFVYVASHTSRDLSTIYALSAFWGGQEGSLLLWLLVLSAERPRRLGAERPGRVLLLDGDRGARAGPRPRAPRLQLRLRRPPHEP